jgi:cysteinyl-tRNA synthetase
MTTLHLYNTRTRQLEEFTPQDPHHVRLYVCGPTVYDFAHIGNARPVVVFDVLTRLLRLYYPQVTYVRNITDVDDKINAAAVTTGQAIETITAATTAAFHEDMRALNALPPDIEPRATHHITDMIDMIQRLIERGHAYVAADHVLFDVSTFTDYGAFSNRSPEEMIAGARVEVAPYKRHAADFVLWKPSSAELPGWESPWGRGRPGWHIECSAMSYKHLGSEFDIHGGGLDLIFPHHENEIAQSRCALNTPIMAHYWVHNGWVTVDGEKMSKSLGNFITVRQLRETLKGEVIRLALLQTHYRQPLDWSRPSVQQAQITLDKFYNALHHAMALGWQPTLPELPPRPFLEALGDDLNTPNALRILHELVGCIHKSKDPYQTHVAATDLLGCGQLLGLLSHTPTEWFHGNTADGEQIESLIAERQAARAARNFARADEIRKTLESQGIILEDGPTGTTWKRQDSHSL